MTRVSLLTAVQATAAVVATVAAFMVPSKSSISKTRVQNWQIPKLYLLQNNGISMDGRYRKVEYTSIHYIISLRSSITFYVINYYKNIYM